MNTRQEAEIAELIERARDIVAVIGYVSKQDIENSLVRLVSESRARGYLAGIEDHMGWSQGEMEAKAADIRERLENND